MNLDRPEMVSAFREFVAGGHGVLIGAPGAGKTYLLKEMVRELRLATDSECLYLPVDRVPFESDTDLRVELGVTGDIVSFFESQTQHRHGFLIVDALDAVRGDRPRAFVLGLVRRVLARLSHSWTVVLSMRTYDALRSVELDEMFPPASQASPQAKYQLPGAVCRHFYVPPLNDLDIETAMAQLPWLHALWEEGHHDLRKLLRTPFNLWLLERLVDHGAAIEDVSPIHSEVELLNLFWRQRVRSGPLEPDQRLLTSRAAETMVRQRTLWARRNDVYEAGANEGWIALQSSEVLQEANDAGTRISFGHNVLFDYAVSVEILDDNADALANFLRQEPDRALFLRPTLNYYFARLWFTKRSVFWEIFWALLAAEEPHMRLVAQVLAPGILAREARSLDDIEPLLTRLESNAPHSEDAVLRVLQAIRTHSVAKDSIWSAFAARVAGRESSAYLWDLARFFSDLLERDQQRSEPDADVRGNVSSGARSLLRLALASHDPSFERAAAAWLIDVVARTYNIDPADGRTLFESILSRVTDAGTPIDLIYRLANSVQDFWNDDPGLAASVYTTTFAHTEHSNEPTHMGGIVVALTSNRRQDFELAQYVLLQYAPRFLREQPAFALRALVQATMDAAATSEILDEAALEERFFFRGTQVRYRQDRSHFWDASGTVQNDAQKLFEAILAYLAELPAESAKLSEAVDEVAENAVFAFIWRSLLKAGTRDATKYTPLLYELLSAEPVISHAETAPEAAAFLAVAAPLLEDAILLKIENAIVALTTHDSERTQHWARRLVAQIPEDRLTTDSARELRAEALTDVEASTNQPLISFSTFRGRYETKDWLRDEGVETEEPKNKRLLAATERLQDFATHFLNEQSVPNDEIAAIIPSLIEALELLRAEVGLPNALLDTVWARVGDAAAVAARSESLDGPTTDVLRQALLACASGDAPRAVENASEKFTSPAWSPAARNAAAQGIPRLLRHRADSELIATLRTLATDLVPSVRYLLALELPRLIPDHEDSFWELAALYAEQERNEVVQQALGHALIAIVSADREELVIETLGQLMRHAPLGELTRPLPNEDQVGGLIVGLAVARRNEWAISQLEEMLRSAPYTYLSTLVAHLLRYVDYSSMADEHRRGVAETALGWLPQIIERVQGLILDEVNLARIDESERGEAIRSLFDVIDHTISRFYFGSGIYGGQGGRRATREEICLFFAVIRPVLRQLGDVAGGVDGFGLPARTAHNLIKLLRGSISCDPIEVLHLTRLAIDGARGGGYAFDPMAAQEVTALVETILVDHREAAQSGESLDDLMHVLDAFVQAGWPEAQRLVWRLEELFR